MLFGISVNDPVTMAGVVGLLTFVAFAQGKKLEFVAYESAAEGLLENVDGKYRIVEVSVQPIVVLSSEADIAAARTIMAEVKENCFISNSITADVKLTPQFKLASDVTQAQMP